MAPFTPFFTKCLYQNLRKASHGLEESIHYCSFPSTSGKIEERIERSVTRMMTMIDLARNIREHRIKPLKAPLKEMVVVHPDTGFLEDVAGKLKEVMREFRRLADISEEEMDDAGDGDVLVILDLRPDESLFESGIAHEVVNRVQKLRQKAGLEPTDIVEVYYEPLANERDILEHVVKSQEKYIRDALGSPLLYHIMAPDYAVIFCREEFHGVSGLSFAVSIARPVPVFISDAIVDLYSGIKKQAENLQTYLLSREHFILKSEFQVGNGKTKVGRIKDQPAVVIEVGKHLFLDVGDYFLSRAE